MNSGSLEKKQLVNWPKDTIALHMGFYADDKHTALCPDGFAPDV